MPLLSLRAFVAYKKAETYLLLVATKFTSLRPLQLLIEGKNKPFFKCLFKGNFSPYVSIGISKLQNN
jgi:hypothetical protein